VSDVSSFWSKDWDKRASQRGSERKICVKVKVDNVALVGGD
jgi:hypothetical protein